MVKGSARHTWAVLAAAVLWGTTGTVAHHAPSGSVQALVGLSTFGFGGALLFAMNHRSSLRLLKDRSVWLMLGLGAIGVMTYAGLYYWSMDLVGVAIGNALALGSGPVFAALLELVIERKRVARLWLLATLVSVVGIGCIAASANSAPGDEPFLGVLLGLGAGFGYALYSWAAARIIARGYNSRPVMASMFAVAAIALLPVFFLVGPGPLLSMQGGLILLYLAAVPMALAYILFGYGLRGMAASTATALALAEPIVATLLAVLVLHERLAAVAWIGLASILCGIALIAVAERQRGSQRSSVPVALQVEVD